MQLKNEVIQKSVNNDNMYSFQVFDQMSDIEKIREIWEKLEEHPNANIDFYLSVISNRDDLLSPFMLVIYKNSEPISLLVGRMEKKNITFKIGYKKIYNASVKMLTIIYGGIIGDSSHNVSQLQYTYLKSLLTKKTIELIILKHLRMETTLYKMIRFNPKFYLRDIFPDKSIHWRLVIYDSLAEYLNKFNSKKRKDLRRIERKLIKDFQEKLRFEIVKDVDQVERLMQVSEEIAKKTYQRGLGVGYLNNKENKEKLIVLAEKGWLHCFLLYIEDEPVAFLMTTVYKQILYGDYIGYDSSFRKYSPGTYILLKAIEFASMNEIKEIDFGFGDAPYKRHLCDYNWDEATINMYSDSFAGFKLYVSRNITCIISSSMERLLARFDLVQKVKTRWRSILTPSAEVNEEKYSTED